MTKYTQFRAMTLASLGAVALAFTAGSATAQSSEQLKKVDTNGDGQIAWEELQDMRMSTFARLDRNDDGVISKDDRPNFGPGKSKFNDAFEQVKATSDTDGDGEISKTEMRDAPSKMFEIGDTNDDGILSADELTTLREMSAG